MKKVLIALTALCLVFAAGFSASAQKITKESSKINRSGKSTTGDFGQIRAVSDGNGVWLEWQMTRETKNLGFVVYRTAANGNRTSANRGMIPGAYSEIGETDSAGRGYSFFDAAGNANSTYTIETLNLEGVRSSSSRVRPTIVADLSKYAGNSSENLKQAARTARPDVQQKENILPADLRTEVAQNAPQADAAKQLWVAAQPGAKIGVRQEGVYRVTRAELEANGFDVNQPTNFWQLYLNGVEQSIIVGAGGNYIEFYGRGIDTTEADTQIYYLVIGTTNGKRIQENLRHLEISGRVAAGTYLQSTTKKERLNYTANVLNGDQENFFGSVVSDYPANINLNLTGIDFSAANVAMDVVIQGLTVTDHQTKIVLNGHDLGTLNGSQRDSSTAHFNIPTAYLNEGANNLQLTSLLGSGDISFFDRVKIDYQRKFRAEQNSLSFYTGNPRVTFIDNFSSANIRVFDITAADKPVLFTGLPTELNGGSYRIYLQADRPRGRSAVELNRGTVLYAVEDSAVQSAATVTANQPSTLTTANHNADLVIITYKNWAAQANDWAAYRRAQGMSVEVVNIEDIYDEFNYGTLSSLSIRNFLQYASANWQTAPRYALLIGDATYDPKNYFGAGYNSFIPTRLVDTVYTEVGADDSLADFNDDGLAELAIGRIPAKSGAYVTQQLNKVAAFEQTVAQGNGISRGALFASDAPIGYDFAALSERVRQQLPPSVPSVAVNRTEASANDTLASEMNSGRFIVNYSGHGTVADWANDPNFFGRTRASQLSNSNLSIFTMLTCLNGYFINPNQTASGDGLAETLLTAQNGAVASWASTGLTTPDVQEIMATRFFQQLGAGSITRLGDLIKDAKTEINFGRDVRLSWVLLGDPTLKVR